MASTIALVISACLAIASALEYQEIFKDTFDDTLVDTNKWNLVDKPSTVNQELQYYSPEDVWQEHGSLFLRGQKRWHGDRQFTGARVDTKDRFSFLYGEVEWRAKLPRGKMQQFHKFQTNLFLF